MSKQQPNGGSSRIPRRNARNDNRQGVHFVLPRKVMAAFALYGFVFVFGVHVYLLRVLYLRHSKASSDAVQVAGDEFGLHMLAPLRDVDRDLYTIRINTWKRVEQLLVSVDHHSSCPGVAQIQVVWCDEQGDPPQELEQYPKVFVERHEVNSLNERFHILEQPPTLGILSMDDDVLRPCEAIDAGTYNFLSIFETKPKSNLSRR